LNNKSTCRGLIAYFLAALVSLNGASVLAQDGTAHQSTVDELLRLDSQAALLAARKNIFGVTQSVLPSPGTDAHPAESNQVIAIYGTGRILTAEVLLESEPHVFKNSRTRPVWGPSLQYRLERIVPPCVYLKKTGKPHVICLRRRL